MRNIRNRAYEVSLMLNALEAFFRAEASAQLGLSPNEADGLGYICELMAEHLEYDDEPTEGKSTD